MDTAGGRYKRRLGRRHQDLVQGALSLAQPLDRVNRVNETKTRGFPGNLSLKPWEKRGKGENLGNVRKTWENKLGIPRNWLMKIEEFKGKLRTQEFIYLSIYLYSLSLSLSLSITIRQVQLGWRWEFTEPQMPGIRWRCKSNGARQRKHILLMPIPRRHTYY